MMPEQTAAGRVRRELSERDLDSLVDQGYLIIEDAVPCSFVAALRAHSMSLRAGEMFRRAGIGRGTEHLVQASIRSDMVHWWDPGAINELQEEFLGLVSDLREQLNRHLFMGLWDEELHYTIYGPGAFYDKHLDQFRGNNRRRISLILYLNDQWCDADGGQLRIFDEGGEGYRDILPTAGVMVLFFSDRILHQVLPANRDRFSLTGWLRARP